MHDVFLQNAAHRQLENCQFRLMTEADIEEVTVIERESFSTPWTKQGFYDSLKLPYTLYYVAVTKQGETLGYCGLYQSGNQAEITNVAVRASARKRQVAFHMLEKLMEEGQTRGVLHFTLEVREGNDPAIRLYEKLGFEKNGIRKNFYRNPSENALIMWKHLQ